MTVQARPFAEPARRAPGYFAQAPSVLVWPEPAHSTLQQERETQKEDLHLERAASHPQQSQSELSVDDAAPIDKSATRLKILSLLATILPAIARRVDSTPAQHLQLNQVTPTLLQRFLPWCGAA